MQNSIELKEVGKSFYKNKRLSFRLKNINLKASESQLIVLKGPNGSGKTTLLKLAKNSPCQMMAKLYFLLKSVRKIFRSKHLMKILFSKINRKGKLRIFFRHERICVER